MRGDWTKSLHEAVYNTNYDKITGISLKGCQDYCDRNHNCNEVTHFRTKMSICN